MTSTINDLSHYQRKPRACLLERKRQIVPLSRLRYPIARMANGLSVSEARKLTGKSESTIKRLVREITADPEHPDRRCIHPSHEEVERLKATGDRYTWSIAEELLLRRFPPDVAVDSDAVPSSKTVPESVVSVLQEQLRSKDKQLRTLETQLDRKDEQIANLNERQRETNILMKSLQERLALDAPKTKQSLLSRWLGK